MSTMPEIRDPLRYTREQVLFDDGRFFVYEGVHDDNPLIITFDEGGPEGEEVGWYSEYRHGDDVLSMSPVQVLLAVGPALGGTLFTATEEHLGAVQARLAIDPAAEFHERDRRQAEETAAGLEEARDFWPVLIQAVQQAHLNEVTALARLDAERRVADVEQDAADDAGLGL